MSTTTSSVPLPSKTYAVKNDKLLYKMQKLIIKEYLSKIKLNLCIPEKLSYITYIEFYRGLVTSISQTDELTMLKVY